MPLLMFRISRGDEHGYRVLCPQHATEVREAGYTLDFSVRAHPTDYCDCCSGIPVHDPI